MPSLDGPVSLAPRVAWSPLAATAAVVPSAVTSMLPGGNGLDRQASRNTSTSGTFS